MARFPSPLALVALTAIPSLTAGCASMLSINAGPSLLATPRAHTMAAAEAHASVAYGPNLGSNAGVLLGLEANGRVTNDYGHGSLGFSLGVLGFSPSRFIAGARGFFVPLGVSSRDAAAWYALGGGLELTAGISLDRPDNDNWYVASTSRRRAITFTLRGEAEHRPSQGETDVWLSVLLGFAWAQITSGR
ncbi:MAG: hypothetical protein U0269_31435 [Polyangiales bacterium]